MADVEIDREGRRTIWLFVPFTFNGRKVEKVAFQPATLDVMIRWQEGAFRTPLALMAELAGEQEIVLRMVRFPDADRVHAEFMNAVPPAVRDDILGGSIPPHRPQPVDSADREVPQYGGDPASPGALGPGFDIDGKL